MAYAVAAAARCAGRRRSLAAAGSSVREQQPHNIGLPSVAATRHGGAKTPARRVGTRQYGIRRSSSPLGAQRSTCSVEHTGSATERRCQASAGVCSFCIVVDNTLLPPQRGPHLLVSINAHILRSRTAGHAVARTGRPTRTPCEIVRRWRARLKQERSGAASSGAGRYKRKECQIRRPRPRRYAGGLKTRKALYMRVSSKRYRRLRRPAGQPPALP